MNYQARIDRIHAHLQTPRGRRDYAAWALLMKLQRLRDGYEASTNYTMDALLKNVYADVRVPLDRAYVLAENPFFAMLKKAPPDSRFGGTRRYVQALEVHMAKAICPECDGLVEIVPNGADPTKTNRRQRLVLHPNKKKPGELCPGGGRDV